MMGRIGDQAERLVCYRRGLRASDVPQNADQRQLTLELRLAATASGHNTPGSAWQQRQPSCAGEVRHSSAAPAKSVPAALRLDPRRAFETAAMMARESVAASMMGRASLEASGVVATRGPRSRMAEVRVGKIIGASRLRWAAQLYFAAAN